MFDVVPVLVTSGFEAVATAFGSPRAEQTLVHLTYVFGLLFLLLGTVLIIKFTHQVKTKNPKSNRKRVTEILQQALLSRSRMDVCFHPDDLNRLIVPCALEDIHETYGTLDLPGKITPSQSWVDKSFLCFFRIPGPKGRPFFYKFTAKIIAIHKHRDRHHLDFALPEQIELGQKRRHLRLKIARKDVVDFRIWAGSEDQSQPCLVETDNWPSPLAIFNPYQTAGLQVLDLSGGGLCLEYDPRRFPSLDSFLQDIPILCMRLELTSVDPKLPTVYYMMARLRTRQEDFDTGFFKLGYEFTQCGQAQAENELKWIKVSPEHGIANLVTWVFKKHLELYREQEIE